MKRLMVCLVAATFLLTLLSLTGCAPQLEPISPETFTQVMTDYGLDVREVQADAVLSDVIQRCIVARSPNDWHIDCFVCSDNDSAQMLYKELRKEMRSHKGIVTSSQNVGIPNNMYFAFYSDDNGYIRIVDNCIIYAFTDSSTFLLEVAPALRELGIVV